ncbi:MAG: M3 family metallopeptidase, partial [Planctomycetota bacterium]
MAATTPANPLLAADGLPAFDRIAPTDVVPAVEALLADAHAAIEKLEADVAPTYDATIEALDAIDRPFERGWSPVGHLLGVKNSDELRDAHEAAIPQMVAYSLRASQSRPIFEALKALADGPEFAALPSAKRRIVTQRLLSAELGGVGLDGEDREAFNKLAEEMSQLTTKFSNNVLDATKAFGMTLTDPADAAGFPATLRSVASQAHNDHVAKDGVDGEPGTPEAGPWRITLDYPSYGPFMEHSRNRTQREQLYRAFATRASDGDVDNTPLVDRILEIRRRQSALLGREHFADVSLATKMAGTVDAVHGLLEKLRDASWAHGEKELAELADRFAADTGLSVDDLAPWDTAFYAERLREERYGFTDEELRPYFAFERVLDGLFALCGRLFGITMTAADGDAPVWNDDVRYFTVQDSETGEQIAAFYLDPYSRPADKRGGAWMADCLQRRRLPDGSLQLPVAHLVCNQTPPAGGKPSLMSFREVETLFHEFG